MESAIETHASEMLSTRSQAQLANDGRDSPTVTRVRNPSYETYVPLETEHINSMSNANINTIANVLKRVKQLVAYYKHVKTHIYTQTIALCDAAAPDFRMTCKPHQAIRVVRPLQLMSFAITHILLSIPRGDALLQTGTALSPSHDDLEWRRKPFLNKMSYDHGLIEGARDVAKP